MNKKSLPSRLFWEIARCCTFLCATLVLFGGSVSTAQESPKPQQSAQTQGAGQGEAAKISPDQLDSLVAPIALYPDPLLAQVLAASTYPLEIIQLQQWLTKNPKLKDKELADAVAKQPWDPSVQSLAGLPEVVKRLADDIQWTTDLGNAFLAQQKDVMDAVQRMRKKAKDKGNLKSNEQQKVETKEVEAKQVIVIEQANPQVVYVPTYNPVVVYGPPVYAYPPIYYPPPGYYAAGAAISFGVGVAMGAMWSGGWCCAAGWGGGNVQINNYNNFNRNANINRNANVNRNVSGRTSNWNHNPQHRGGAPYSNRATADKFGGAARGESLANRQATAQQRQANRQTAAGERQANRQAAAGERAAGARDAAANRTAGAGATGERATAARESAASRASGGGSQSAFGGGSGGYNGSSARAASSRGSASMGSRGGGGFRGGGGGGRRR
jgi:hypothetical protein